MESIYHEIGLHLAWIFPVVYYLWLFFYGNTCENFKIFRDSNFYWKYEKVQLSEFLTGIMAGFLVVPIGYVTPILIAIIIILTPAILLIWTAWKLFQKFTSCTN